MASEDTVGKLSLDFSKLEEGPLKLRLRHLRLGFSAMDTSKSLMKRDMTSQACNKSTMGTETGDCHKLEGSMGYMLSSRPAWAGESDPVYNNNK